MSESTRRCLRGIALVEDEAAVALSRLLGDLVGMRDGPRVPMIAPAMLLGTPEIKRETRAMRPPEGMGVVHESQMFRRSAPTFPEGRPDIWISEAVGPDAVRFDFQIGGDAAITAEMQTRLRFVTPDEMAALRGTAFSERFETPQTVWCETGPMGADVVMRYVALAHDDNPIHTDESAAQNVGLAGTVVPGMMLCGLCEYALLQAWPDMWLREIKTRFMAAVRVGQAVRLAMVPRKTDASGEIVMARVFAVTQDNTIAAIMDVQMGEGVSPS